MVLTNIELWAADGSSGSSMPLDFESGNHSRHLNPFDPRVVPQINSNLNHLSSNGYYGFSYVNAAHDMEINNNNNNISNINHNNNNCITYNLVGNDVNGINNIFTTPTDTTQQQQTHASSVNFGSSACAAGHAVNVARCKKRFFVMNDDDVVSDCSATKNKNYYNNNCEVLAKRCRFDDDFSAQYCNDFFQLPATQIATQSCLMDTEEGLQQQQQQQKQQQQQQVDVAMFENNNNNIEKYEQKVNPQLQTLSAQHQQEEHCQPELQSQTQQLQHESQQQQLQPQQQHLYHQQQHYQDIQIATIKCHHFNHNNNCDTLPLKNQTCKIDFEKNTENVLENQNSNRNSSIQNEHDNNDAATDIKVDDATLFAQLHGGFLYHHDHNFNYTSENYIAIKHAINNHEKSITR